MENQTETHPSPPPPPPPPLPPPQPEADQEPTPKKLKMSSTTTTSDDENTPSINPADGPQRKPKYKRRKIAMFFAYCGVGYQGMQKNPGAKTIEGDLEEALFLAGAVPEQDRGCPKRFDWARSARTDKGVSAVGQVVSGRFYVDPPGLVARLNSILPAQIRIFGYKRATGSFNAKKFCDRRRYVYLIPVFALDPTCHRDRESVIASTGSGNELVKCVECSERGRKVFGVMGKKGSEQRNDDSGILSNTLNAEAEEDNAVVVNLDQEDKVEKQNEFRYGQEVKERFNRILKYYEGTHNFHNFTTRTKADDPAAKRYIISFRADTELEVDGMEFIKCEVVGQSFMLHQIRKMIGLAVAIMRNIAPESLIESAFRKDVDINVPMAPEVGLYLDECFFSSYNQKWKDSHDELSMKDYRDEAEEFKMKFIYSHIASMEQKEGVMALFLHSLNYRNYSDLRFVKNDDVKSDAASLENVNKPDVSSVEIVAKPDVSMLENGTKANIEVLENGIKADVASGEIVAKPDVSMFENDTRANIEVLENDIKADVASVENDTKADVASVEIDTKADVASVEIDTKADVEVLENDIKADVEVVENDIKADVEVLENDIKADVTSIEKDIQPSVESLQNDMKPGVTTLEVEAQAQAEAGV